MNDELLHYYHQELAQLREQGQKFAQAHPKVAERLKLGHDEIEDPLVARLLESVTFLTARIQHKIDHQHSTIINDLITLLYPTYLMSAPAMGILQYQSKKTLQKPYAVPAQAEVYATTPTGKKCTFSTGFAITLNPIQITQTRLRSDPPIGRKHCDKSIKSALSITLQSQGEQTTLHDCTLDTLRLFTNLASKDAMALYELIFSRLSHIVITSDEDPNKALSPPPDLIKPVGFNDQDALLPTPTAGFAPYRLLLEFFAFPQKFLFFDITTLTDNLPNFCQRNMTIHLMFTDRNKALESTIYLKSLALNCTPIVNLFKQAGDPIQYDKRQTDYHIIANAHATVEDIEVYDICSISVSNKEFFQKLSCSPYFGKRFDDENFTQHLYWQIKRKPCWQLNHFNLAGSECFVSFSEIDTTKLPDSLTLTPYLTCSNRELPNQLPHGHERAQFQFTDTDYEVVESINTITEITSPKYRPTHEKHAFQLLSHLTLNQMSLHDPSSALATLKDNLKLYAFMDNRSNERIIKSITNLTARHITTRHPNQLKQGFCQGSEVILTIDESHLLHQESVLLGQILHRFLSASCSINAFIKLILHSKQRGEIMIYPPLLGIKETI